MKKTILILALFIASLFADNREIVIFNKKLYQEYLDWENEKIKERSEITLVAYGKKEEPSATNCIEYLKYYKDYNEPATSVDDRRMWEYINCEIINHIGNAKVIYQEKIDINYAKYLYNSINVRSFPNSLNARLDKPFVTLRNIFKKVNITNNLILEIEELDWYYTFKIVGLETKDNKNYLLVYFSDKALESSYFSTSFLVFDYQNNKIKTQKQALYKEANQNSKTNMYLVINDVVEILDEKEDWIYILYITKDNKEIKAWIPKNSLEYKNNYEE